MSVPRLFLMHTEITVGFAESVPFLPVLSPMFLNIRCHYICPHCVLHLNSPLLVAHLSSSPWRLLCFHFLFFSSRDQLLWPYSPHDDKNALHIGFFQSVLIFSVFLQAYTSSSPLVPIVFHPVATFHIHIEVSA